MSNGDHTIDRNLFDVYHDSVLFVKINNTQQRRTNTLYVLNPQIEWKYYTSEIGHVPMKGFANYHNMILPHETRHGHP